jgi:hypothetical protein
MTLHPQSFRVISMFSSLHPKSIYQNDAFPFDDSFITNVPTSSCVMTPCQQFHHRIKNLSIRLCIPTRWCSIILSCNFARCSSPISMIPSLHPSSTHKIIHSHRMTGHPQSCNLSMLLAPFQQFHHWIQNLHIKICLPIWWCSILQSPNFTKCSTPIQVKWPW